MEHGSSLGTYLAYALIALFLLVVGLIVARTMVLMALLLVEPIGDVWTWLSGSGGTSRRTPAREEIRSEIQSEIRSAAEVRGVGDEP